MERGRGPGDHLGTIRDITDQVAAARVKSRAEELVATSSNRERQVLSCLAAGAANKNIAYELGLSQRTVEGYRARLMDKLGVRSIGDLLQVALAAGIARDGAWDCGLAIKAD